MENITIENATPVSCPHTMIWAVCSVWQTMPPTVTFFYSEESAMKAAKSARGYGATVAVRSFPVIH